MTNYQSQYLKIYLWKTISILLGFISLFVVIPSLSSDKVLYGIYSVCTSLTIFFSYADLGFLSSGAKYAAEYYIKNDHENEVKVIGFTAFFMMIVFLLIDAVIIFLACKPEILIPELILGSEHYKIAQKLLLLLALGCPFVIGLRVLQVVFMIRVEDYKYQIITIIGSLIKILSVFFFFNSSKYDIVGYYAFFQFINFAIVFLCFLSIKKYGYKIRELVLSFRFDKKIFREEKGLSIVSFLFMLAMMLYNEFDQIAISKIYGVEIVSLYAIAFSIMTFMRTYSGLVYAPFTSRFNHFVGLNNYIGLAEFTKNIVLIFGPILIIPLLTIALYARPFVDSWVGHEYAISASLIGWMVMSYAVNFITNPLSCFMTALEKNKDIAICAVMLPLIYWIGIGALSPVIGYKSFAIMKFVSPTILVFYYWKVVRKEVKSYGTTFIKIKSLLLSVLPSVVITMLLSLFVNQILNHTHSKIALAYNLCVMFVCVIISLLAALIFNLKLREIVLNRLKAIFNCNK